MKMGTWAAYYIALGWGKFVLELHVLELVFCNIGTISLKITQLLNKSRLSILRM